MSTRSGLRSGSQHLRQPAATVPTPTRGGRRGRPPLRRTAPAHQGTTSARRRATAARDPTPERSPTRLAESVVPDVPENISSSEEDHSETNVSIRTLRRSKKQSKRPKVSDGGHLISRIKKMGVEAFEGTGTPEEADVWLRELEKIFRVIRCDDLMKVTQAVFILKGTAQDWWEGRERTYPDIDSITWEDFRTEFTNQYMPESYRTKKSAEFFALRQGNLTVEEFDRQFRALIRFVPSAMATDSFMKERFLEQMSSDLHFAVAGTSWPTYGDLVQAAIRCERGRDRVRAEKGHKRFLDGQHFDRQPKKFHGNPSSSGGPWQGKGHREQKEGFTAGGSFRHEGGFGHGWRGGPRMLQGMSTNSKGIHQGGGSGPLVVSPGQATPLAQKPAASVGSTPRAPVVCFVCGEPGHFARECSRRVGGLPYQAPGVGRGRGRGGVASGSTSSFQTTGRENDRTAGGRGDGQQAQGHLYAMNHAEAQAAPDVVEGTLSISNIDAHVLIDPGATHSFVSTSFATRFTCARKPLENALAVGTPGGLTLIGRTATTEHTLYFR